MSAIDHLRAIGRGDTPPDDGLLGNARCAWGGSELVGEEAIVAAFCEAPFDHGDVVAIETAHCAALVGETDAVIADVYDGRIGRLWRVGSSVNFGVEPAIDVAFDTDLQQRRGDICFRAEDHPDLAPDAAAIVLSAARDHIDKVRRAGSLRVRGFVIRAFGNAQSAAALLAVYTVDNREVRSAGFDYAILSAGTETPARVVSPQARLRAWSPRF